MNDQEIRNRIVRKMMKKKVFGNHKKQIDTVVDTAGLPKHEIGHARDLLNEMADDVSTPIERYGGGHRDNVRLTGVQAAVDYLKGNGGDVPFGFG